MSCRLRLAGARNALEYHSFHHSATYTLRHAASFEDLANKKAPDPEAAPESDQTATTVTCAVIKPLPPPLLHSPPPLPLPPHPFPPPPMHQNPPTLTLTPSVLAFALPAIHTNPPSPHLSWGACSDADVYSRIGAFRLSSLSNQSKVILFEHSSL